MLAKINEKILKDRGFNKHPKRLETEDQKNLNIQILNYLKH